MRAYKWITVVLVSVAMGFVSGSIQGRNAHKVVDAEYTIKGDTPKIKLVDEYDEEKDDVFDYVTFKQREEFVGEVYGNNTFLKCDRDGTRWVTEKSWLPFKESNVTDEVDGNVKIRGEWFKAADLFYYADIYDGLREEIEKAHRPKVTYYSFEGMNNDLYIDGDITINGRPYVDGEEI